MSLAKLSLAVTDPGLFNSLSDSNSDARMADLEDWNDGTLA